MTPRPRVFVSSVVDGFESFRAAARAGLAAAGCESLLVNEDFPLVSKSSRNACLDGVESCDAVLVVLGGRGGWTAPSGKLVVQEEFDHARARALPTYVAVQDIKRDADAEKLRRHVEDYLHGQFRRTFRTPEELTDVVAAGLRPLGESKPAMQRPSFRDVLDRPHSFGQHLPPPTVRVAVAPERRDDGAFDLSLLDSETFLNDSLALARRSDIGLFSPLKSATPGRGQSSLFVLSAHRDGGARFEVRESGLVVVDVAVIAREHGPLSTFAPVVVDDVAAAATKGLLFASSLFEQHDRFHRYATFFVNASLGHLQGRHLTTDRSKQVQSTQTIDMATRATATLAFEKAERVSRTDKTWPTSLAPRLASRIERAHYAPQQPGETGENW